MVRLATRSWGDGDPTRPLALLVHGITSSSRTWWLVGPALAERGLRVLAVDLRGHGQSPRGAAGLGPADLAADVAETVAAAGAGNGRAADGQAPVDLLVGHSLGALVVLALLGRQPGFARRVVLEDPPGPNGIDWAGMADGIEHDVGRALREPEALRSELEAVNPAWAPGEAARRVADLATCDAVTVAATLRARVPFDLAGMAAAVDVPTLLVLAEEALGSNLVGTDRTALVHALRQGTTRELRVGHSVHREALGAWLRALDDWLADPAQEPVTPRRLPGAARRSRRG
jgi:pimeloyl-ACP methyl ester carboxylesterase